MLSLTRHNLAWQLILADLALILFLMTAAALSADQEMSEGSKDSITQGPAPISLAPAQALYRAGPSMPSLAQWLESQPRDPRASLTIIAEHTEDGEAAAWLQARSMADTARAMGVRARVVLREGKEDVVQASFGFDQPGL